jgi:hypothetical protein
VVCVGSFRIKSAYCRTASALGTRGGVLATPSRGIKSRLALLTAFQFGPVAAVRLAQAFTRDACASTCLMLVPHAGVFAVTMWQVVCVLEHCIASCTWGLLLPLLLHIAMVAAAATDAGRAANVNFVRALLSRGAPS